MLYSIYAESTPNPEVMKFVSNRMLADKSVEFLTKNEAEMKIFDPHNQISWDIMLIDRVEWFQFPFIATNYTII